MQKRIISAVLSVAMLGTSVFSVPFVNAETTAKTGDIDASGMIDVTDLTELSLALLGDRNLSEDQKKAADVDGDGAVTLADLAKFRQYLSKKISRREFENITLESIVDITERDGLAIPAAIEKFYEDEYFKYEFGGIKSSYVECTFSDGSKMNVKEALESGMVTISDLDKYKIDYRRTTEMTAVIKEVKAEQLVLIPAEGSKELRSSDLIVADYVHASEQKYKAGDTVVVEYDGYIYETYPAQIVASSVRIIEKASDEVEYSFTPISVRVTVDHSIDEYPQHQMITDRAGFDALFTEKQELEIEESGGKLAKLNGKYTDEWFETHKLYVAYPGVGGPTSTRYKVEKVTNKEVTIYQNLLGQSMSPTEELADWIIFIEVSRDADVTEATEIKFNTVY